MSASPSSTYPSTADIGYAAWLKHFAVKLPAYAEQYGLTPQELTDLQQLSTQFTTWLIECTHQATELKQGKVAAAIPNKRSLLDHAVVLVRRIRAHPAYTAAQGSLLGFATAPQLKTCYPAPPTLRIAIPTDRGQAPMLTWLPYRGATLQVEVCRDGRTWQPLPLLAPKAYQDAHQQPSVATPWHYRARYSWPDWPAGQWGPVVTTWVGLAASPASY